MKKHTKKASVIYELLKSLPEEKQQEILAQFKRLGEEEMKKEILSKSGFSNKRG